MPISVAKIRTLRVILSMWFGVLLFQFFGLLPDRMLLILQYKNTSFDAKTTKEVRPQVSNIFQIMRLN